MFNYVIQQWTLFCNERTPSHHCIALYRRHTRRSTLTRILTADEVKQVLSSS